MSAIERLFALLYSELYAYLVLPKKRDDLMSPKPEILAGLDLEYSDL